MPRQPRLHVPGGFYHATLRGNHRNAIFRCDADYQLLDHIVAQALEQVVARLHAFCWMPNHLHLLVQVAAEPLGKLMQRIGCQYARAFQSKLETTGHLFERRYHAQLVDTDSYLLEVLRYIHLNPVRAGLVEDPATFPWSSHRIYLGMRSASWVTSDFALQMFHADRHRARKAYAEFVTARLADALPETLPLNPQEPRVLGDDKFISALGALPLRGVRLSLEQLAERCCRRYLVSVNDLQSLSRDRRLSRTRLVVAHLANAHGIASIQAVARFFCRDESSIRRGMERLALDDEDRRALDDMLL